MDWGSKMGRYKQEICTGDQEAGSNEENELR